MLKVGRKRKRKERKEGKKHTNSISRIRARASRPAVSFACLRLHHAAKKTKYKTRLISDPPSEKDTLLTRFQMQIRFRKRDVNRANIFCRKKLKQKRV